MVDFEKLKRLIADILEVDFHGINENSSPDNVEEWDSFSHVKLIIAIESEFKITLTPEDTIDMMSVKLIKLILEEKTQ